MGKRVDFADLASDPIMDAPVPFTSSAGQVIDVAAVVPTRVAVGLVAANPVNPRESLGDLSDLESMVVVGQLQPCAVVTRGAFLTIYPEYGQVVGSAEYVVVAGSRRRAAAERFGLDELEIRVHEQLAQDRATFFAASVTENIDRRQFDPLEEALAVRKLADELGEDQLAGQALRKSKGWVSQRLALLKLSPQMQRLLRDEVLPIRDARRLAAKPVDEQFPAWEAEQRERAEQKGRGSKKPRFTAVNQSSAGDGVRDSAGEGPTPGTSSPSQADGQSAMTAREQHASREVSFLADDSADEIAGLLRQTLSADRLAELVVVLSRG